MKQRFNAYCVSRRLWLMRALQRSCSMCCWGQYMARTMFSRLWASYLRCPARRTSILPRWRKLFADAGLNGMLPALRLQCYPLVDANQTSGPDVFWRKLYAAKFDKGAAGRLLEVSAGSLILWGHRIFHGGLANHGDAARPTDILPPGSIAITYPEKCQTAGIAGQPRRVDPPVLSFHRGRRVQLNTRPPSRRFRQAELRRLPILRRSPFLVLLAFPRSSGARTDTGASPSGSISRITDHEGTRWVRTVPSPHRSWRNLHPSS